jgi:hypothetical protein
MRVVRNRDFVKALMALPAIAALGLLGGCNDPQFEAGTVKVDPRGSEAEPEAPGPIDPSTRDSSEGGER